MKTSKKSKSIIQKHFAFYTDTKQVGHAKIMVTKESVLQKYG